MAKFELKGGLTTKQDYYDFANIIYQKAKSLREDLEKKNVREIKKDVKDIEINLDVLRKYLKREA